MSTIAKPEKMARHEVRGEEGRVPARDDRHGEVEGHHGVHRQHQRRGEGGEVAVGLAVVVPLASEPRQPRLITVYSFLLPPGRASRSGRDVGDHAQRKNVEAP